MCLCEGHRDNKSLVIIIIIIIRNCHCYYITKSATLDNMDGSDAILCWQSTNHHVRVLLLCIDSVSVVLLLLRC